MWIAARRATWTKLNVPLQLGMSVEQAVDGPESLRDALGVVHPVDADEQSVDRRAGALARAAAASRSRFRGREAPRPRPGRC